MVDYVKMQATAERLIAKNGRSINLIRFSEVPTNPNKPWEGTSQVPTKTTVNAVAVPPNTVRQFGLTSLGMGAEMVDLESYPGNVLIVAQEGVDLRDYSQVEDYDGTWTIDAVQILRPGDVTLLGFLAVSQ